MLLPNQCSFCAHQRIHAHKSPYCCPECGVLCRSAYFQTHVKENCLHYARKVGYRWVLPGLLSWYCPMAGPFPKPELISDSFGLKRLGFQSNRTRALDGMWTDIFYWVADRKSKREKNKEF